MSGTSMAAPHVTGVVALSDGSEHSEKTLELGGCRHEHQFKIKKAG